MPATNEEQLSVDISFGVEINLQITGSVSVIISSKNTVTMDFGCCMKMTYIDPCHFSQGWLGTQTNTSKLVL